MKTLTLTRHALLACAVTLLVGCGSSAADTTALSTTAAAASVVDAATASTTDADDATTGVADDTTTITTPSTTTTLTADETATLLFVREEEKLARDVYLTLFNKWGTKTFQNIALNSEQQHMDVMGTLVATYNLQDPVVIDTIGAFTDPVLLGLYQDLVMRGSTSLNDGLHVGGFIEEFDINDLQEAIDEANAGSKPADIIAAYTNLMCGSRNHLRSFVGQIEKNGVDYQAQVIPQATVDAIVNSPEEQCGK
ncbi:MAG: DUF2202 domain-containing protein [Candidatus Thiothrix putei]|uniref:DUF2202 domain-containing protein n=2 Tax=Thiothrix TaxID=1030 RepID=A0A1H3VI00_9GAMM|nr:DUF2202 domain-containing protein [Thiothrix caldifontis]WGZ93914.1 MAG: DUF2202 domain-containing protein [Candidatus Thiothrix putei]SDZ73788.1 hypothetical protein SAMN05660964_00060 [Thiothrix caldifontis]